MNFNQEKKQTCPCILCGHNDFTHIIDWIDRHRQPVSLSVCQTCGLRQLNPRMNDTGLEKFYASTYYKFYSMDKRSESSKWVRRKQGIAEGILNAVESHRQLKGLKLLDVGCGHGFLITEARARGAYVSGVEPSVKHAERLHDKGFDVHAGTLEQFAADHSGQYDVVVCSHVLEHSGNPQAFLKCASSLLAPNGFLCAEVPNAQWQTVYGRHPVSIHIAHLCYHTERSLRALFETSGLHVLSISYGLYGGSVRAIGVPGLAKNLKEMDLDDPAEIRRETLIAFNRHTAPWPFKQFWYALRMVRKAIVKLRFKQTQKSRTR